MVEPYLNQVGGKVDGDVNFFSDGLNSYVDKAFIDKNAMPFVMNMTMCKPPMLTTRPPRGTIADLMGSGTIPWIDTTILEMFSVSENEIYLITRSAGTTYLRSLKRPNSSTLFTDNVITIIPTYNDYYITYVVAGIYNGSDRLLSYTVRRICKRRKKWKSQRYTLYQDNHYGIPCWHKGRLWLAKPSTNIVEWSNALEPDNFLIGEDPVTHEWGYAGEVYVTTAKGVIKNIVSFDDKLVILCEHSMHVVYGTSGDATDVNYFQLVDLSNNLGTHSARCVAIGGGCLFWLGDDYEVYQYSGSSIDMISRPQQTRYTTVSTGGISNIFQANRNIDYKYVAQMSATASKLYFNIGWQGKNKYLFVFDTYSKTWWCEDGEFTAIEKFASEKNEMLLARPNGDVLIINETYTGMPGSDVFYNFETQKTYGVPIEYEFHTKVFGADGTDTRKTLSKVWFQARADAEVFINDIWTSHDKWQQLFGNEWWEEEPIDTNYRKIGTLYYKEQPIQAQTINEKYVPSTYEQQVCYVEKMYSQRTNAFQIIVKGTGDSKFYLMKREWRVN